MPSQCLCGTPLAPDILETLSGELIEVDAQLCEDCEVRWFERELEASLVN